MKSLHSSILTLTFFIFCLSNLKSQQISQPRAGGLGTWRLLGHTQAKFTADHDAIYVAGPYDFFRRLKFKVTDAPINMIRMIVRYDDGGAPENIDIRFNIPQGGESRVIDLRGGRRKLKSCLLYTSH